MALADIEYEESDGHNRRFRIDLGHNRYYAYAIGPTGTFQRNGIPLLSDPAYQSRILGPLESDDGRGELEVPEYRFGRENRFIQLHSFRTPDGTGPAVSRIVETEPGERDDSIERTSSMRSSIALSSAAPNATPERARARRRKCHISETKALSTSQFIDALVSMLPQLLPVAGGLIGSITGNAANAAGVGSATTPPWLGQLMTFVQQLLSQSSAPVRSPTAPLAGAVAGPPVPAQVPGGLSISASQYSEAMIAPALLAALPALMPLLQQVLSPQTVQTVLQAGDPNRLIGTISNAINSFAQLGMQNSEAERAHLRALNPGVDDPALMALLGQMSSNLEKAGTDAHPYRRTEKVVLHFAETATVMLGGKPILAYATDHGLQFPLSLQTVKPVPPGILRVTIEHAETLERCVSFRIKTPPLAEGRLSVVPQFKAEELHSLQPGHDYLVKAQLVWKNKTGNRIGTATTQTVRIVGEYTFDGVREGKDIVALNDVDAYRDFWHKVWQDSFTKEIARREYECKYYYLLKPELTSNEQADTQVMEKPTGIRKVAGRLKSGTLLSPNRLNELLPKLTSDRPLAEAELKALLDPRFLERVSIAARYHAKFGGPPERPAALWVFPEVKIQNIVLRQADRRDASGHVISMSEREVRFPVPVLVHFVGVEGE